jgi:hypothetical protein
VSDVSQAPVEQSPIRSFVDDPIFELRSIVRAQHIRIYVDGSVDGLIDAGEWATVNRAAAMWRTLQDYAERLAAAEEELAELRALTSVARPPFDGEACPACPVDVRFLYNAALEFLQGCERRETENRIAKRAGKLHRAVVRMGSIVAMHFGDPKHCASQHKPKG